MVWHVIDGRRGGSNHVKIKYIFSYLTLKQLSWITLSHYDKQFIYSKRLSKISLSHNDTQSTYYSMVLNSEFISVLALQ